MSRNLMLVIRLLFFATLLLTVAAQERLPGTGALTMDGDLAAQMVDGINNWLIRETDAVRERRSSYWQRDYSSQAAYEKSISTNRDHLRRIIGVTDPRVAVPRIVLAASLPGLGIELDFDALHRFKAPVLTQVLSHTH